MGYSLQQWRELVRQAWLMGLLERRMKLAVREKMGSQVVMNTYETTAKGRAFIIEPHTILLPDNTTQKGNGTARLYIIISLIHCLLLNIGATAKSPCNNDKAGPKGTRTGKGCHILPVISNLLSSAENWYPIASSKDYHFPGEFEHPYPQRLGYCSDFTTLADYDPDQPDFLYYIQLAKGTARSRYKKTLIVDGVEEEIEYRVTPCNGVKICGAHKDGCEYVTSLHQHHPCPNHLDLSLVHSHKVAPCLVEFVYIKPVCPDDNRRWLTGVTRDQKTNEKNSLHSHSLHAAMSLPSRVKSEFTKAAVRNPHLKT